MPYAVLSLRRCHQLFASSEPLFPGVVREKVRDTIPQNDVLARAIHELELGRSDPGVLAKKGMTRQTRNQEEQADEPSEI